MPFRLKRIVSLFLLTLVVLTSSARCGRESKGHFPFAYVQNDCGPADGPALHFYFTQKQSEAGKYKEPLLDISINENLPKSAPQDYSIRSGSWAVLASRCLTPGQCVGATYGTLLLTKFDERRGVSGEYKFHFKDGSVEKGSFDATRCFVPLLCG
jgi:hypothetical protein